MRSYPDVAFSCTSCLRDRHRAGAFIAVVVVIAVSSGCGARTAASPASAAPRPDAAASVDRGARDTGVHPPVPHLPVDEVDRPFDPPAGHSPIVEAAPVVDARSVYGHRAPDAGADPIAIDGSGWMTGRTLRVLDQPLGVRVAPGAAVTWYAPALGTFANGRHDVTVTADATGLARVAFKPGQDPGDYRVIAVSPSRSGVATFILLIDR